MFKALYRKWRPKTFDDMVGQEHITVTLKNEVAAGTPSHAYLFCGSRGTGKTSCAKILAKAVNCPDQEGGNPCCACATCRGIENDSILDVTEIDAASNSGVDNIRELREEANFTPAAARYRVYIIDETHMLSPGAWGALLKIMEEPPEHVIFVLATTEIHKVPATILSRVQRFDFRRIPGGVIAERLLYIAAQEGIPLTEEAARLIARLADGGMRDALSLLDLCGAGEGEITAETVRGRVGLVGREHLFRLADAIQAGDIGGVFRILEELWEQSADCQRLCEQLIEFYRNLMVAKAAKDPQELIACLPEELPQYEARAKALSMQRILYCLGVLQDILGRMGRSGMRRAELETGLLRLADPSLDPVESSRALAARLGQLEHAVKAGAGAEREREEPAQKRETRQKQAVAEKPEAAPTREEIGKTPVERFGRWNEVLQLLREKNKPLYGTLVGSTAYVGGDMLLVDAGDGMFAEMVRGDSYARQSLRAVVQEVTGVRYRLGPYSSAQYEVKQTEPDKLLEMLEKAGELGVDVQIE